MEYMEGGELFDYIVKCKKYLIVNSEYPNLRLVKYSNRSLAVSNTFTSSILFTGISNLKICWLIMIRRLGLWILVFRILTGKIRNLRQRVGRRAMLLLKWFRVKIDMKPLWSIYGAVVSFCMPCCVGVCRFKILKRPNCIRKYWLANIKCLSSCLKTQRICWRIYWTLILLNDSTLIKSENTDGGMYHLPLLIFPTELLLGIIGFQLMMRFSKRLSSLDLNISSPKNVLRLTGTMIVQRHITFCLKST